MWRCLPGMSNQGRAPGSGAFITSCMQEVVGLSSAHHGGENAVKALQTSTSLLRFWPRGLDLAGSNITGRASQERPFKKSRLTILFQFVQDLLPLHQDIILVLAHQSLWWWSSSHTSA
jgi:hypothetical protein